MSVLAVGEPTGKGWQLSLIDVDPDESPYAMALLPEGPPWLELPSRVPEPGATGGGAASGPAAGPGFAGTGQ